MDYTHLTQDERYQMAILSKAGHNLSDIAQVMSRHKSTIGRETPRNRGERGCRLDRAPAPALGLIFADDGWAMTPSVMLKNGKHYRYYVNTASSLHMVDGKARLAR